MPATVFPIICRMDDVKQWFVGLGDALAALSDFVGRTEDEIFGKEVRQATREVEVLSHIPFFVTRFSTRELARQMELTLGDPTVFGYDRMVTPLDYDFYDWRSRTGNLELAHAYLKRSTLHIHFSTEGHGQLWHVPDEWVNVDDRSAVIDVIPWSGSSTQIAHAAPLAGFVPMVGRGQTFIRGIIHQSYSAGLVDIDYEDMGNYDPDAALEHTEWDPDLVVAYQGEVGKMAASEILQQVGGELDGGGVSVSFDGLSQSVNSEILLKRAELYRTQVHEWADTMRETTKGPAIAFA